MANRLTSITTGTGDDGTTGIVGGDRLSKDDPRIEAIGCVDELNCSVGLALAEVEALGDDEARTPRQNEQARDARAGLVHQLLAIQHDLFDLGGELAMPPEHLLQLHHHTRLARWQEHMNASLEPLANFILPGGNRTLAALHLARSSARRAERRLVRLSRSDAVNPQSLIYLNRLSDLLFVAARWFALINGTPEHLWQQNVHRD